MDPILHRRPNQFCSTDDGLQVKRAILTTFQPNGITDGRIMDYDWSKNHYTHNFNCRGIHFAIAHTSATQL